MHIHRVALENFKSHLKTEVRFEPGTNAICGENKAGKTSILQAIGLAVFGSCQGRILEYIREGAKAATITVDLFSARDERLYSVERRIGSAQQWRVLDPEVRLVVADGSSNVQLWLCDHLGLNRGCDLKGLFEDAVGVPQGELTAAFTDNAAQRKCRFDSLLHVEEYQRAFQQLLELINHLQGRVAESRADVARLEGETIDLSNVTNLVLALREEIGSLVRELDALAPRVAAADGKRRQADAGKDRLSRAVQEESRARDAVKAAETLLQRATGAMQEASGARTRLDQGRGAHEAYRNAEHTLSSLRTEVQKRDQILTDRSSLDRRRAVAETTVAGILAQIDSAVRAEAECQRLKPLVSNQDDLEKAVNRAQADLDERDRMLQRKSEAEARIVALEQSGDRIRQQLSEIENLRPIADEAPSRLDALNAIRAEFKAAEQKIAEFPRLHSEFATAVRSRDTAQIKVKHVSAEIHACEGMESLAQELGERQASYQVALGRIQAIAAEIRAAQKGRSASADGLCPFLHEACLNVAESAGSLSSFFDQTLEALEKERQHDQTDLDDCTRLLKEAENAARSRDLIPALKRQLETQEELLDQWETRVKALACEVSDAEDAEKSRPALRQRGIEALAAYQKADAARQQVASEPALTRQLKQDEVALEREMAAVRTMDGGLKGLVGCEDRLSTAKASLAALGMAPGDPRTLYAVADKEAKRRPDLEKKKDREQAEIDRLVKELQRLDQDLSPYAGLDDRIREQEALQRSHRQGHQVFIANEQLASQLDRRKSEDQQARLALEKAVGSLGAAVDEHRDAAASYDAAAHERCILELDDLKKQQTMASTRKQEKEIQDAREARRLEELTVKAAELAEKRAEQARREGLSDAAEMVRKCIKAAGPKVTEQLVGEISRAAERIFNELIGDHSVGLKWTDDYEIRLINDGRERTLWPAAGSERVTAALAVRLALLECMSEIRFAFFDEPTIHLDETRRSALVDQLLGLNNFDQIFVISHDDSFERATDHMVRLTKVNGRTEVAQV